MSRIRRAVLAVALAIPWGAQAQGFLNGPDSSWYIGGSVGQSAQTDTCFFGASCDGTDTAYRAFAGYQFNRYLALELGYGDLGTASISTAGITQSFGVKAYDVVVLGILPVAERLDVYGKFGAYRATTDFSSNFPGVPNQSVDNNGPVYGVGVQYDVTGNLGVRAEWVQYARTGNNGFIGTSDVEVTGIGVLWRFK